MRYTISNGTPLATIQVNSEPEIILDFHHVEFISCADIAIILRLRKTLWERNGGSLKIINVSPFVYELFFITRLTRVLNISLVSS